MKLQIYADEAWTHTNPPLRRYWNFFGGIMGSESDLGYLDTKMRALKAQYGFGQEVKWTNLKMQNEGYYHELVDLLFEHLRDGELRYRQMFSDRTYAFNAPNNAELDGQFKIYYQFLKHAFGLQFLPELPNQEDYSILVRLDEHSSQHHKSQLIGFAENIPTLLGRNDINMQVTFVRSSRFLILQVCDLLMGAAGFHGNRIHEERQPGQRGMRPKQKLKHLFAKSVYDRLRSLDNDLRGRKAFNWFEDTGIDGDITNRFTHKLRIWKFIPKDHAFTPDWQNNARNQ